MNDEAIKAEAVKLVSEVQMLRPEPGDVVIVKLGDRDTGWIPEPAAETRMRELLHQLWHDNLKLQQGVNFLVTHAFTEFSVIRLRDEASKGA